MKIVVFKGSPRKNGFSAKLLNQVIEGAKSAGAEIITYDLNGDGIKGCQGCFYCRTHEGCCTQDALQPMYKDIQEADGVIATFPLYFGGIGGQSKSWLDRMYPMLGEKYAARYPGKKVVTIFAQGNPNPDFLKGTIDQTNSFFKLFGWDMVDTFLITNTHDPACTISEEMMHSALEAGKALCEK